MTWVHIALIASFAGLLIVWPISFFGYRYYQELIHSDESGKH